MNSSYMQTASVNPEARRLVLDCINVAKHTGNGQLEARGRDIIRRYEGVLDPEASIFPFEYFDQ